MTKAPPSQRNCAAAGTASAVFGRRWFLAVAFRQVPAPRPAKPEARTRNAEEARACDS